MVSADDREGGRTGGSHHAKNQPASHSRRGGVMKRIVSGLDARRLPRRVVLSAAAMLAGACFAAVPAMPAAAAAPTASAAGVVAPSTTGGQFGANVFVFNPSMTQESIHGQLDSMRRQ